MNFSFCLGASVAIKNKWRMTPLQAVRQTLSGELDPEARQLHEKVHEKTVTHFDIANVC